ncbi:MAG: ribonuclease [Gemmatimonadetes bacterium]|nr:ribonuclease [Gemmatimonadota bacterium]
MTEPLAHSEIVEAARRAAIDNGFEPDPDPAALAEAARATLDTSPRAGIRDTRDLPWSSIDNRETRDLDQLEWAEELPDGGIRLWIAIADVEAAVPRGSALDLHAATNSTSVYTGIAIFPMLPEKLSTDLTSLVADADRLAVVVETIVAKDGSVSHGDIFRAVVRNRAKMAYEDVGAWLEGHAPIPGAAASAEMTRQLTLQGEAAKRLKEQRLRNGALEFDTIEATPVTRDGRVVDLTITHKNKARDVIEDFMIASNIGIATYLEAQGRSGIRRVVREPKRWNRIVELAARFDYALPADPNSLALAGFLASRRSASPESFTDLSTSVVKLLGPGEYALDRPGRDPGGHFGLAAHDYTHATAPNRRYADLVTQRLVKAALAGEPAPYDDAALEAIAAHCTEREDAARKVERSTRKTAAASLLHDRVGQRFEGIVTGVTKGGTFARLLSPPAEGRVLRGESGLDVGDHVTLELLGTSVEKGFIDLANVTAGATLQPSR